MKARLDEKVGKLRSQVMSFANDGIQVSLNIPDTGDVKETFGSVINTVAEQHEEIQVLHTDIESTATESNEAQKKLLAWTASCLKKLKEENEKLQAKLLDANKQIKNLSYNMQGFVDQGAADEAETMPEPLEFDDLPKLQHHGKHADTGHASLFPTEEGAEIGAASLGFVQPVVRTFARYKGPEQREAAKEYYLSVRPNTLPATAAGRWRWAIRKVMSTVRRKKTKVGLTRSRVDPKQSFAGRLDRVEALMQSMSGALGGQLADINKSINHKIDTALARVNLEVSTTAGKLHMLTEDSSAKFKDMQQEIAQVDATMREFFSKMESQSSGDTRYLKEALKAMEIHMKDLVHMEMENLRGGVNHVTSELDQVESAADKLQQRIEGLHTLSVTLPHFDPHKPIDAAVAELTDLLQVDTQFREVRTELTKLQAGIGSAHRVFGNVMRQIQSVGNHYTKDTAHVSVIEVMNASQRDDLIELNQRCIGVDGHLKHIESIFASMERMCIDHDRILKDRWKVFISMSHNMRDLGVKAEQIVKTLAEQPVGGSGGGTGGGGGGPGLTKQQEQMFTQFERDILDLNLRVGLMETMSALQYEEEEEEREAQQHVEDATEESNVPAYQPPAVVPSGFLARERSGMPAERTVERVVERTVVTEKRIETHVTNLNEPSQNATRTVRVLSPREDVVEAEAADHYEVDSVQPTDSTVQFGFGAPPSTSPLSPTRASTSLSPTGLVSASPSFNMGSRLHASKNRKSATGLSDSRRGSAMASLEMLEAKLRPFIEKIVGECVDERMLGMDGGEEEDQEGEDGQLAELPGGPAGGTGHGAAGTDGKLHGEEQMDTFSGPTSPSTDHSPIPAGAMLAASKSKQNSIRFQGSRIRRESSRFGGLGDGSGKRGGSSKFSGDLGPYIQEITTMKKENSRLSKSLAKLEEDRMSKDEVERMFHHLYQQHHHNEQKEESNHAVRTMERRIDTLTKELSNLHATHTKAIAALQAEFSETLYKVVTSAAQSLDAENTESFVSTRALCLGCGRSSMVRTQPESRPTSPSFFPQIGQHSTDGPDVHRGGFKLPVKNPLNPTYVLEANSPGPGAAKTRAVRSAGQRMQEALMSNSLDTGSSSMIGNALDAILPRVKAAQPRPHSSHHTRVPTGVDIEDDEHEEELFPTEGSQVMNITGGALEEPSRLTAVGDGSLIIQANKGYQLNIASTTAPVRATSAVKVVRQSQGRPEAEELRPIYRKGFPATKKSIRAETAYAHERYELDLPNNILLTSSKVSNAPLVPGTEGVVRPYSSHEGSRPRMLAAGPASKMSATMNGSTSTTRF